VGQRLRVSGRVAKSSLNLRSDRASATLVLSGEQSNVQVSCKGPIPDNLAEDMDVVVEGTLEKDGLLRGERVLTRCASKYQAEEKKT
jgi:cytochrome c-type biogenesis protein CcmE